MRILSILLFILLNYEGNAQSDLTFVFLNKRTDSEKLPKDQLDKLMEGHMANIRRLADEGKLIAAGPFDGGGGIFVFKTSALDTVTKWIGTDPAVAANRWKVEILPYLPMVGSICKVGEPYEMVNYHFVRFSPVSKANPSRKNQKLFEQHKEYWRKQDKLNPLVTFASFPGENGDILVTAKQVEEATLVNDPAFRKGLLKFDKKVLWIAKGSFCE